MLQQHLAYTAWATNRLMRAIEQIPPEHLTHDFQTSDRSILGTMVHVFGGDRIWLRRVKGEPVAPFLTDDDRSLATLQRDWPAIHAGWLECVADPSRVVHYHDLKGNPYSSTLSEIVMHVVNHATHHRGQVSGFLRTLGHTPPPLDLIFYYRELQARTAQASSPGGRG
jgi:uncharacterized damage-inducible protein DinB